MFDVIHDTAWVNWTKISENTYRSVKPAVLTESSVIALHPAMALRNLYRPFGKVQHSEKDTKEKNYNTVLPVYIKADS